MPPSEGASSRASSPRVLERAPSGASSDFLFTLDDLFAGPTTPTKSSSPSGPGPAGSVTKGLTYDDAASNAPSLQASPQRPSIQSEATSRRSQPSPTRAREAPRASDAPKRPPPLQASPPSVPRTLDARSSPPTPRHLSPPISPAGPLVKRGAAREAAPPPPPPPPEVQSTAAPRKSPPPSPVRVVLAPPPPEARGGAAGSGGGGSTSATRHSPPRGGQRPADASPHADPAGGAGRTSPPRSPGRGAAAGRLTGAVAPPPQPLPLPPPPVMSAGVGSGVVVAPAGRGGGRKSPPPSPGGPPRPEGAGRGGRTSPPPSPLLPKKAVGGSTKTVVSVPASVSAAASASAAAARRGGRQSPPPSPGRAPLSAAGTAPRQQASSSSVSKKQTQQQRSPPLAPISHSSVGKPLRKDGTARASPPVTPTNVGSRGAPPLTSFPSLASEVSPRDRSGAGAGAGSGGRVSPTPSPGRRGRGGQAAASASPTPFNPTPMTGLALDGTRAESFKARLEPHLVPRTTPLVNVAGREREVLDSCVAHNGVEGDLAAAGEAAVVSLRQSLEDDQLHGAKGALLRALGLRTSIEFPPVFSDREVSVVLAALWQLDHPGKASTKKFKETLGEAAARAASNMRKRMWSALPSTRSTPGAAAPPPAVDSPAVAAAVPEGHGVVVVSEEMRSPRSHAFHRNIRVPSEEGGLSQGAHMVQGYGVPQQQQQMMPHPPLQHYPQQGRPAMQMQMQQVTPLVRMPQPVSPRQAAMQQQQQLSPQQCRPGGCHGMCPRYRNQQLSLSSAPWHFLQGRQQQQHQHMQQQQMQQMQQMPHPAVSQQRPQFVNGVLDLGVGAPPATRAVSPGRVGGPGAPGDTAAMWQHFGVTHPQLPHAQAAEMRAAQRQYPVAHDPRLQSRHYDPALPSEAYVTSRPSRMALSPR